MYYLCVVFRREAPTWFWPIMVLFQLRAMLILCPHQGEGGLNNGLILRTNSTDRLREMWTRGRGESKIPKIMRTSYVHGSLRYDFLDFGKQFWSFEMIALPVGISRFMLILTESERDQVIFF